MQPAFDEVGILLVRMIAEGVLQFLDRGDGASRKQDAAQQSPRRRFVLTAFDEAFDRLENELILFLSRLCFQQRLEQFQAVDLARVTVYVRRLCVPTDSEPPLRRIVVLSLGGDQPHHSFDMVHRNIVGPDLPIKVPAQPMTCPLPRREA